MVVLPTPGGPHKISDASEPRASIRVSVAVGPEQMILAHDVRKHARTQPSRQRPGGCRRGIGRGIAGEQIVRLRSGRDGEARYRYRTAEAPGLVLANQ